MITSKYRNYFECFVHGEKKNQINITFQIIRNLELKTEMVSGQSKEMPLVIYLAFLTKVANLYYTILTTFKEYWPDIVATFISGTQETFI